MKPLILFSILVFVSRPPLQAQWQFRGIQGQNVHSLLTTGSLTYAGSDSGSYRSTDDGLTWVRRSNGLPISPAFPKAFAITGAGLFAATNGAGGVYLTTNDGLTWGVANSGLTGTAVHALVFDGSVLFAGINGNGVFQSTNNGGRWQQLDTGLTNLAVHSLLITGNRIFAGTDGGVFVSTNNGGSWSLPPGGPITIRSLASIGTDVFAASNATGIFKSTDNGLTWATASNGLTSLAVRAIISHGSNLFAGTNGGGVQLSTNGGNTWAEINTGLSQLSILSLAVNANTLYAGALIGGVWTRPLSEIIVAVDEQSLSAPLTLRLEQNYPNPFNPMTTIIYHTAAPGHVRLEVYNEQGGRVATLVDKELSAGAYSARWDASAVASGVYFYRLESGTGSATRRLTILK